MRALSKILLAVAIGALAAPALAGAAKTPGTHGIVVQRDAKAGAIVVATPSGKLLRVKLAKPNGLAMGAVVQVTGSKVKVVGHARKAKLRGVVVRRHRHSFALAGNGSVLAVTSPTPPPAGQAVTATVQVSSTALSDDDGEVEVDDNEVSSTEVRGTVMSQDANFLRLTVAGFPSGLPISIAGQTIPVLPLGTLVKAHVTLGPDPTNQNVVVLTLVSLRVENTQSGDHHDGFVKAEGKVTDVTEAIGSATGSITIEDEHGSVTFVIPAGFGPTGVVVGDEVEAKGTASTTVGSPPTLTRLEGGQDNNEQEDGDNGDGGNTQSGSGSDD